jgi:hypothetical protein
MELAAAQIERAKQMAGEGRTIAQISKELEVDWRLVRNLVGTWDQKRSWRGTKQVISLRLNSLIKEQDPSKREQMVSDVKECVDYLYYQGMHLGSKVERARKTLND